MSNGVAAAVASGLMYIWVVGVHQNFGGVFVIVECKKTVC